MSGAVTVFAGLPIPSTSPVFLAAVGLHVLAGLTCVAAGAVAMLSRKGRGRHSTLGTIYFRSLAVVFGTAAGLSAVRWAEDYPLFILATVAFGAAWFGRASIKAGAVRRHIIGMGGSYIVLLTAFYIDNGRNLPLWRELPTLAYWLVPGAVGAPIMVWALLRHPLARNPRRP